MFGEIDNTETGSDGLAANMSLTIIVLSFNVVF